MTTLKWTTLALAFGLMTTQLPAADEKAFNEADFVKKAASSSLMEIELGKMASERAQNQGVKDFGAMMVKDHTKATEELKEAAKSGGAQVPEKMTEEHQKHVAKFKDLKGEQFDREYMALMVTSHEKGVAMFTSASKMATTPAIKNFATKTLPTLQAHLDHAKKLQKPQQ